MRKVSLPGVIARIPAIFTHRYAFWFLTLHLAPLAAGVALAVAFIGLASLPKVFEVSFYLYVPFLLAQLAYLLATGKWRLYQRWLATRFEVMKDKFAAVTTNVHLAAQRIGSVRNGGFFVSMAPPSFSNGFKPRTITYRDDRHVAMIAGSRAGKGRDFIIPNLAHWQGSVIAYDPSGELVRETADYRARVLGQKVIVLDPFGITDHTSDCWNPLAEVDFDNDPLAVDQCHLLAESLHSDQSPDPFWMHAPRKMLASVIGYVGTRSIKENCHLGMVRDLLMSPEPQALWLAMSQNDALGGFMKRFGDANEHRHLEELNSTMELARTAMKWLDSPVMQAFTQKSTFSMRELKQQKTTIYIVMPASMGAVYAPWLRLLFNAAFDVMQDQSIEKPKDDVLFLMDEFPLLGHMERIKRAAGEAAKFGVKLFICAQDVTQLKEHYGQAWETFIANAGLLIMFANNDLESQQYLSQRLGKEYYKKYATSSGGGAGGKSASTSTSLELRDVARPDQVEWQASRQSGHAFIFIPGMKPMRLPRGSYDRWDMLSIGSQKSEVGNRKEEVGNQKAKAAVVQPQPAPAIAAE